MTMALETKPSAAQCREIKCPHLLEGEKHGIIYRIMTGNLRPSRNLARCRISGKVPGNMTRCPEGRL